MPQESPNAAEMEISDRGSGSDLGGIVSISTEDKMYLKHLYKFMKPS